MIKTNGKQWEKAALSLIKSPPEQLPSSCCVNTPLKMEPDGCVYGESSTEEGQPPRRSIPKCTPAELCGLVKHQEEPQRGAVNGSDNIEGNSSSSSQIPTWIGLFRSKPELGTDYRALVLLLKYAD